MVTGLDVRSPPPGRPAGRPRDWLGTARALGVAALASLALLGVYAVFVRTREGQRLDQSALDHVGRSLAPQDAVRPLLETVTVGGIALVLAVFVVVALVRRSRPLAWAAVALVAGANLTTELLKHEVLTRPSLGYGGSNSLPSGHTTVVVSLVLAGLVVVPRGGRAVVGMLGSVGVAVTGVGTVVAGWHRPSDVVAGLAVTLAWGAVVLAALAFVHGATPATAPRARPVALMGALAVAAGLFFALGVRTDGTVDLLVHAVTMCGLAILSVAVVGLFGWMVDARLP